MTSIAMEEYELLEDQKYRSYMSQVDRCLKAFESVTEWADLILHLSKLNKILLANMKYPIIPRRTLISKRLAQCMHPDLPSGVHQKALETYDIIFKCMGTNRLSADLFIYSAGLFPLLANASLTVRSELLKIYETHFVPLGHRLRPGLNGFLSGVLPGLEEGSDHYQKTNSLLEGVCEAVEASVFYSAIWECVASNATVRLPALTFVLAHCGKKGRATSAMENQPYLLGTDHDVMCRALCLALQDSSALVQRSALDLLLLGFPIHQPQFTRGDMVRLVAAVLTSLLRRDMSLNRRLFSWLLGSEINPDHLPATHPMAAGRKGDEDVSNQQQGGQANKYFTFYTKELIVPALVTIMEDSLNSDSGGGLDIKPYRIITTLLDKPEIGPAIIDPIILDIFRTLYHMSESSKNQKTDKGRSETDSNSPGNPAGQDLIKTANLLFSQLDTSYVWSVCTHYVQTACQQAVQRMQTTTEVHPVGTPDTDIGEMCLLVTFLLDIVSIETYMETSSEHLPRLFVGIVTSLKGCVGVLPGHLFAFTLGAAKKVLGRVQPAWNVWDLNESLRHRVSSADPAQLQQHTPVINSRQQRSSARMDSESFEHGQEIREGQLLHAEGDHHSLDDDDEMAKEVTESKPGSPVGENGDTDNYGEVRDRGGSNSNTPTNRSSLSSTANRSSVSSTANRNSVMSTTNRSSRPIVDNRHPPLEQRLSSSDKHEILMSECRTAYTDLFAELLSARLLASPPQSSWLRVLTTAGKSPTRDAQSAILNSGKHSGDRTEHRSSLGTLLCDLLTSDSDRAVGQQQSMVTVNGQLKAEDSFEDTDLLEDDLDEASDDGYISKAEYVRLRSNDDDITEAFTAACSGLIELSSIPNYPHSVEIIKPVLTGSTEDRPIPIWLQGLIICATNYKAHSENSVKIQLTAISTLLELIGLLKTSLATTNKTKDDKVETVPVNMDPLVKEKHLGFITSETRTIRLVGQSLWFKLGSVPPAYHPQCVTLIHRLLGVAPSPFEVENVIAESLQDASSFTSAGGVRSICVFRRFAELWHLSRDLAVYGGGGALAGSPHSAQRTLDLCLLKMVSGLQSERSAVRALCERWVEHCLARGDAARLVEPLLFALLEPCTARLSVLHANIKESSGPIVSSDKNLEDSPRLSKVFAISSVDNNIIYHVSSRTRNPHAQQDSVKKINLIITQDGKTMKTNLSMESPVTLTRFPYSNINMSLNPFALVSSESEFNQDPCSTPELPNLITRSSTPFHGDLDSPASSSGVGSFMDSPALTRQNSLSGSQGGVICARHLVASILDDILDDVVASPRSLLLRLEQLDFPTNGHTTSSTSSVLGGTDSKRENGNQAAGDEGGGVAVHPLHSHILLYCRSIDSRAVLHTFTGLSGILSVDPRLAVSSLATTGVASPSLVRSVQLAQLLARHKRSVFGKGFSSPLPPDSITPFRSAMLLEVVLSICLYYLRSYYPSIPGLSKEELQGNREVQISAVSLLNKVCSELIMVVKDNGKPFALYISDLFSRIKLQKVILHCLLSGVHNIPSSDNSFTVEILRYNDQDSERTEAMERGQGPISVNSEAFQVELLKLALSLVMLEEMIFLKKFDDTGIEKPRPSYIKPNVMKYCPDYPFSEQPMFLAAILSALKQIHLQDLHHQWTGLVVACLPFLGCALSQVVTSVCDQIWSNLESLSRIPKNQEQDRASSDSLSGSGLPHSVHSDYVLTQLESLGHIFAFCLQDTVGPSSGGSSGGVVGSGSGVGGVAGVGSSVASSGGTSSTPSALLSTPAAIVMPPAHQQNSIVSNLVHVFGGSSTNNNRQSTAQEQLQTARKSLLSMTPRLLVAVSSLWAAIANKNHSWLVGSSKAVKNMILELLSPLATVHSSHFLAAVAVAWSESSSDRDGGEMRDVLVELVSSLKMFPTATIITTTRQVVKSPPPVTGSTNVISLDLAVLQFISVYLSNSSESSNLKESWTSFKDLLKDCLSLKPLSVFLALEILHQYIVRGGTKGLERRETRELQELTVKLVEAVASIAGSRLDTGTWLRGNRTVKLTQPENESTVGEDDAPRHAVTALKLLGQLMANMLDIIYQSEEKEKVNPLLNSVMYNVVPYLRHHTKDTLPMLREGSRLLASLSEYPYTRKAWRREAMEILLDPAFFQMDHETLKFWKTTTDNLMTHDKTTFKELLTRIAGLGQSNMSLFSSKELEQEQRALLLKRLAFVIFCSDVDQYQKQMPDITDRLSECLRAVPMSPSVQAAVFLCFRVIILRMSAVHVTFLWPVIVTEMVVVFSYIEHQLIMETDKMNNHIKRVSLLDSSFVTAAGNSSGLGLQSQGSPAWLNVYLAVCKLLDQAAALPASLLPQFQMYRWAFVREGSLPSASEGKENGGQLAQGPSSAATAWQHQDFVPHIARISKLIESKVGRPIPPRPIAAGEPLLTMRKIDNLTELGPWFSTLSVALTRQQTKSLHSSTNRQRSPVAIIERIIELDFLEQLHDSPAPRAASK